jgi:hypothetical protein
MEFTQFLCLLPTYWQPCSPSICTNHLHVSTHVLRLLETGTDISGRFLGVVAMVLKK